MTPRGTFLAVLTCLTACTTKPPSTAINQDKGWVLVSNAAGGFSVLMPTQPKEDIEDARNPNGPTIPVHHFQVDLTPTLTFALTYNDYPEPLHSTQVVGSPYFFDTIQQGAARMLGNPTLLYSRDGKLNGHPTRQFCYQVPQQQARQESCVIVVRHRMYHLYVISRTDTDASRETQIFFNSFRLLYD